MNNGRAKEETTEPGSSFRRHLREYDVAWDGVVRRAVEGFVDASELLGRMARQPTQHVGPIRNVRSPQVLDQPFKAIESTAVIQRAALRECDVEAHTSFVAELASEYLRAMKSLFFRSADEISDAAGTTRDAGGPLTWDLILDMLEQMPVSFDRWGQPTLPVFIAHPETLDKLPAITEQQRARQSEILRRKGEEHAATKRSRRLPR